MNSLEPEDKLSAVLSSFWEEIFPKVESYTIPIILKRIQSWVGEQPEMTEALCSCIVQHAAHFDGKSNETEVKSVVDQIIQSEFVENWQNSAAAFHLHSIQTTLLEFDPRDSLLILYIQILQRGTMPLSNSPEQSNLVNSGLVNIEDNHLKVANLAYAKVFDLDWVEQQLPGITKPFVIVDLAKKKGGLFSAKLYSQIAAVAFGLIILGAAISSYIREPNGQAIAKSNAVLNPSSRLTNTVSKDAKPSVTMGSAAEGDLNKQSEIPLEAAATTDRTLFDEGSEHAQNSRWVPMMRDFCKLSEDSVYFAPAEKRLEQWVNLYPDDIKMAQDIVAQEQKSSCSVVKDAIEKNAIEKNAIDSEAN